VSRTTDAGATWNDWSGGQLSDGTAVSAIVPALVTRSPADPAARLCWKTAPPRTSRRKPATTCALYFPNHHHNLTGAFLDFWKAYGGETVFGDPRTEAFVLHGTLVQYTDRFRLEWRNGRVVTAPLGLLLTRGHAYPTVPPVPATADRRYFGSTGHTLSGPFLTFWRLHHGALLLGAPISQPVHETNDDGTGRVYIVQWFAHGRLDYHPELTGTGYDVEVGLVGKQDLQRRGWLPRA
jgi:hypothetical protein